MKAVISLDGILSFIHSLSLSASNKQWLGEKLLEEARQEKAAAQEQSYADYIESLCGAWKDDPRTAEEITDDLRQARQFGVTRHIRPIIPRPKGAKEDTRMSDTPSPEC